MMKPELKKAKIQALLARLDELEDVQAKSDTQAMVDEMLKEELDAFRTQLNGKHTTKAIEKLRADLSSFKDETKLEPIYQAIAKADTANQNRAVSLEKEFTKRIQIVVKEVQRSAREDRKEDIQARQEASRGLKMALGELSAYRASVVPQLHSFSTQDALLAAEVSKLHQQILAVRDRLDSTDVEDRMRALIEETNKTLGARIASIYHGGNMNRNMALNGNTSVLSRYTDVNWKSGANITLTPVKNDVTKYTDITISASGGGAGTTFYTETPSGAINGVNKVYSVSSTLTQVINFALNGQYIHPIEYVAANPNITFGTAIPSVMGGLPFTVTYV